MTEPIEIKEPMHPEARVWYKKYQQELQQRESMLDALIEEVRILKKVEADKELSAETRYIASMISWSFGRVVKRWRDGTRFDFDTGTKKFFRVKDQDQ